MNLESWLDKADRLRGEFARVDPSQPDYETQQRLALARWLRTEFSEEPPEDRDTLPLFRTSPHQ